ncbi:DNA topoisomerase 2-binding protein 1 isoform X2 [Belonocnema kinseyi]|uniref:DNA topoisomerase 2-binding protein 1 isoform X2 n=1 Tax=Belonocnema kinseyi TaxID=2817044 RepID=UPI00143D65BD|nr:DNA topoisomerase 2-binding protein 1 isoform X2 [Belonocnema kinseyi]
MASQESTLDPEGVTVYFVIPSKYASDKECSDDMWLAYNKCEELDINPVWLSEKKCLKMEPQKKDVFVMEEFDGKVFESLKACRCSIVGPRCLLCCFMNNEMIPEGRNPVFVTAMRDLVVCASGFTQDVKAKIQLKVEYMGGIFARQLLGSVTHLVTDRIMSQKHEQAVKMKIKIMTVDWINAVWKENLTNFVKATDPSFEIHKCPVFMNAIVTATDLSKNEKLEIKNLVTANGGQYMGHLDGSKTNILLASEKSALTEKLRFALNKEIPCLKYQWVMDSIEAGYALPFENYVIHNATKASSTPERTNATLNFSCISVIPFENQNGIVDESIALSMMSRMNSTGATTSTPAITPASTQGKNTPEPDVNFYITFLDNISLASVKKLGTFLDGCNIYLAGLQSKYKDKLNKIVNVSGATRLDEITDSITHVLVGDIKKAKHELKVMFTRGLRPHIVNIKWLDESMKLKHPAPEEDFLIESDDVPQKVPEPPSPLSKKNLEMLQRPQRPPPPKFDVNKEKPYEAPNEPDLVQEYLKKSTVANKSMAEVFQINRTESSEDEPRPHRQSEGPTFIPQTGSFKNKTRESESLVPLSQTGTIIGKVFEGLTFLVNISEADLYQNLVVRIDTMGGRVVSRTYPGIPDFAVVPMLGTILKSTVNEIVTELFIDDCVDKDELVPLEYYHRPILLKGDAQPLQQCVIAISTYSGQERPYLQFLSEALGAVHQDTFARKTNLEKKTYASTHLICPAPEGQKYNAAVKWKLPAVSADWLLKCAERMELVSETPYLIGETMASQPRALNMKPPLTTPRTMTPMRIANVQQQETPGMQTPLVNKRLSAIMNKTPQSPFHISTPETPYGIMFKDNPSPDTRKAWLKWADSFPDLRENDPPPAKRRAPSTPFSELRRQMWEKLKEPLDGEEADEANTSRNESNRSKTTEKENSVFESDDTPTNRQLSYADENSPSKVNQIDMQLVTLQKALRASTSTAEKRFSLSAESAKKYQFEPETDKCLGKESQPFTVGWQYPEAPQEKSQTEEETDSKELEDKVEEDPSVETSAAAVAPVRKFMLSGIKDKEPYENLIKALGGEVSMENTFDSTATHLLCIKPARNEKTLGSIASGKWILHCTYIKDSADAKMFLDEEKYEWGNPLSVKSLGPLTNETEKAIASAAHRWRVKLSIEPGGAFEGMVALLMVPEEKYDSFERLIVAGNGTVVQARSSYDPNTSGKKITHCFIQIKSREQAVDWARMASKGILCFQPQFLHNLLTTETPLNPRENVLPEFKKYLALLPK